jgi:hypothetical protein
MPGRPARRPAATSEAAPQSRAMGPSSGRERGSAISAPYRSSDCQCAPSTSPQIGIPFPNRRQVVKQPHLQSSDFVHPHACQRCHGSQRRARCATSAVGRHVSSQRTVAFGIGSFKASGRPRIEPSVLTRNECQLASQSCWQGWNCRCRAWPRLPHQLDLRARDCEANHVPRQRLERVQGHAQDVVHRLARHRPCVGQCRSPQWRRRGPGSGSVPGRTLWRGGGRLAERGTKARDAGRSDGRSRHAETHWAGSPVTRLGVGSA